MHDIEIDFNHPLAGKDILFCAEIHSIEPAAVRTP
jgi:FKBP-type peptidyl-prolyl cis-trans isomerase 2